MNSLTMNVVNISYRFDCAHKASIREEDGGHRDTEVAGEHVHDVGLVVKSRAVGVVVWSTGALQALRNVPVWE